MDVKIPGSNEKVPLALLIGGGVVIVAFIVWQRQQNGASTAGTDQSGLLSTELDQRMNDLWNNLYAMIGNNTGTPITPPPSTNLPSPVTYVPNPRQHRIGIDPPPDTSDIESTVIIDPNTGQPVGSTGGMVTHAPIPHPSTGGAGGPMTQDWGEIPWQNSNQILWHPAAGGPDAPPAGPDMETYPGRTPQPNNGPMVDDNGNDVSHLKRLNQPGRDLTTPAIGILRTRPANGTAGVPLTQYGVQPQIMAANPGDGDTMALPARINRPSLPTTVHPGLQGNSYPSQVLGNFGFRGSSAWNLKYARPQVVPSSPGASPFPSIDFGGGPSVMNYNGEP